MAYLTDIEIAQNAKMQPITEIAKTAGVDDKYLEQYGKYKAKVDYSLLKESKRGDGKLILVTAITPTPAGEGKTTTTIGLADGMKVVGTTFGSQVLPLARLGSGFQEVAVFHKDHVGIEHLGEFFSITWRKGIASSVTFGHDDGRAVETDVRDDYTLAEATQLRTVMVKRLGEVSHVLFGKLLAFQWLDFGDEADGFQLVLKGCLGDGWKCQKAECQKQP